MQYHLAYGRGQALVQWQEPPPKATSYGFEFRNQPLQKKKFRGKANYQSPPPNPTKVGALCIGYDHISYSIHQKNNIYNQ